jgi:hypothetical protein
MQEILNKPSIILSVTHLEEGTNAVKEEANMYKELI